MKKVYVILLVVSIATAISIRKKSAIETPQPAIIAIEIVDPNENSTTSKNSKRTIDNSLGYGYNNYEKPRYEIYKYSQHDIPGYKGKQFPKNPSTTIQKSLQYTLPTITEYTTNPPSVLKPGTTLYSSLTSKGQVGNLRSSLSQIPELQQQNSNPVPVILLRIYPDQLQDSTIHANLPQGHPFAKAINSVNIQSLLNRYVQALRDQQQYQEQNYQQQQDQNYQNNQHNYYQQQQYQQDYSNNIQVQEAPVKYQFQYQSTNQQLSTPKPQYYYVPAAEQQESQQYYPDYQQQYQDYYSAQDQQKLLTEENYPSNKHTRVIFKTDSGKIRTPESENPEIKTIKIQIPENVAKVEVQESERPYYDYQQQQEDREYSPEVYVTPPTKTHQKPDQEQENYYNNYYNPQEKPTYDYQSLNYEEMAKYLSRRGVLNQFYYRNNQGSETEAEKSSDQMIAAYEDGFPSTTAASARIRKVKSKKRAKLVAE